MKKCCTTIGVKIRMITFGMLVAGFLNAGTGIAQESRVKELAQLSIEELVNIKVTSVLKTERPLSKSPAAVYVVTQEDIRRSGAQNITDLLRMVPGVQVAELDENIYAVSIRGFNDIHANKLLVMIDGRSIYNHIFSGVIWSNLNMILDDIERIEVIRGPGSSVWGANAVNGVINIITKKAADTKGVFAEMGAGNPDIFSSSVRYGAKLSSNADIKLYARGYKSSNNHLSQSGYAARTDIDSGVSGFRADWQMAKSDQASFWGEFTTYSEGGVRSDPIASGQFAGKVTRAWYLMSRWQHTFSERSKITGQVYFQHEGRVDEYRFDTVDLDFQHDYSWSDRNRFTWGLGYRFTGDEMHQGLYGRFTYDPTTRHQDLYSLFIQDAFDIVPDTLELTLGSKFEHNDYTGYEVGPSARMLWTPHRRHSLWAAVSRAVRTPSRIDSDSISAPLGQPQGGQGQPGPPPAEFRGSTQFDSEDLVAYEIGYRTNPWDMIWFDLATFYNVYDHLSDYKETRPNIFVITNDMEGKTYGVEVSVDFRPVDWWRLACAWSYLRMNMSLKDENAVDFTDYVEQNNPRHQVSLHSAFNLGRKVELDLWLRYVDEVRQLRPNAVLNPPVRYSDSYTQYDIRLAWHPVNDLELSVTGRNLGGPHKEYSQYEVEQSLFFNVKIDCGR